MPSGETQPFGQSFGPDQVYRAGDRVIIDAARRFPDWTVREFSRPPIFFEGKKYFLLGRNEAPPPFAVRYELAPWPSHEHQESNQSFSYDLDSIQERDGEIKTDRREEIIHHLLLPLSPLFGFAWARFREVRLMPLGFNPRSLTSLSVALAMALILMEGIFVGWLRSGFFAMVVHERWVWLDWLILVALVVDTPMRYSQLLRDDEFPAGFFEWLWSRPRTR